MQPRVLAAAVIVAGLAAVIVSGALKSAQVACAAWHISNVFNAVPDVHDVVRCLEAGADLEARTGENGWTPLHHAALVGTAEIVTALLEAGADSNAPDNEGKLPIDYAEDNRQLRRTDAYRALNADGLQLRIRYVDSKVSTLMEPPRHRCLSTAVQVASTFWSRSRN